MARKARKRKPENALSWTMHNSFHWSAMLDGSRIDYWPTKGKWMHDGAVQVGNVCAYIAAFVDEGVRDLATQFVTMDADKQAQFFMSILRQSEKWGADAAFQWSAIGESLEPETRAALANVFNLIVKEQSHDPL